MKKIICQHCKHPIYVPPTVLGDSEAVYCSRCGQYTEIEKDEEDFDPYAGCEMTPDPEGKTTADNNDR